MKNGATTDPPPAPSTWLLWQRALPFATLFGVVYFVQGFAEPTAGLVSQPFVDSFSSAGFAATEIGAWLGIVGLPWSIKPLAGLMIDFIPLGRLGRSGWLLLGNLLSIVGYGCAALTLLLAGGEGLVAALLLASSGVAIADVATDALAISRGQPLGITGQLQSVQWGALSLAGILAGELGGYLAASNRLGLGMVVCALLGLLVIAVQLILRVVHPAVIVEHAPPVISSDEPTAARASTLGEAYRQLILAAKSRLVITTGLFLFLWSFNPFSTAVLQSYATDILGLDEQFYGRLISVQCLAMFVTACVYGIICRMVAMRVLVHLSIAAGIACTLAYWGFSGATSGVIVTLFVGAAYMLGTLIQLDLAARVVPIRSAGTVFALLMAISNSGLSASLTVGGFLYDQLFLWTESRHAAFHLLVGIGGLSTSLCWLVVPFLPPLDDRPISPAKAADVTET